MGSSEADQHQIRLMPLEAVDGAQLDAQPGPVLRTPCEVAHRAILPRPLPEMVPHLALLSPVERQDRRLPRAVVVPRVRTRPLVEMTKLVRNRARLVPVAIETPVEMSANVAPDRTVGIAAVAPLALGRHVLRCPERGAVVDVDVGELRDLGMHAVLRAQEHVPRLDDMGWKTVRESGSVPLARAALEPVAQRFENGRKGDAADTVDFLPDGLGLCAGPGDRKQLFHLPAQALRGRPTIAVRPAGALVDALLVQARKAPTHLGRPLRPFFPGAAGEAEPCIRPPMRDVQCVLRAAHRREVERQLLRPAFQRKRRADHETSGRDLVVVAVRIGECHVPRGTLPDVGSARSFVLRNHCGGAPAPGIRVSGHECVDAGVSNPRVRKARLDVHRHRVFVDIRGELLRVSDDDPPLGQQRGDEELLKRCLGCLVNDEHVEDGVCTATRLGLRLDVRMLEDPDRGSTDEVGGVQNQARDHRGARAQRFEQCLLRRRE